MHEIIKGFKPYIYIALLFLLVFTAGSIFAGLLIVGQRSFAAGKLNQRYDRQYARAAETIGRLEIELERERDINNRLREYNSRARGLAENITGTAERNVRNLQDAISLIGEIRAKVKVLEEFYADSGSGDGVD